MADNVTSAEREARERAYREAAKAIPAWQALAGISPTFNQGWAARAEYARGATVAEIVEEGERAAVYVELGDLKTIARDKGWDKAFDWIVQHQECEARFSPAPPRDYNDTRPSDAKEPQ